MAELSHYRSLDPYQSNELVDGKTKDEDEAPVKDRYHLVRITMYFFGISCLLPWNFFTQANDYWMYKFRNVSLGVDIDPEHKTELQTTFSSYLAIASKVPYVLFLLVNTAIANRYRPETRMQYPLAVTILLFIITVIMVPINSDNAQYAFFAITISLVVAINVMCGFLQGAGTGIAGCLPKAYMGYNVNGMAVGGVLASITQILCLVGDTSSITSAILYFVIAVVILCITFVLFLLTIRTDFYKYYLSKQVRGSTYVKNDEKKIAISKIKVFVKLWEYAVGVTVIFWVTISVLPAVLVNITSVSNGGSIWTGKLFVPVACFFLFNACDLGGRILAVLLPIPSRCKYVTLALTFARIVFIPLIMLCNANPREHTKVVFDSDLSLIIIIFFFAITNGYLCNVILTQGPKMLEEQHQEQAGTQMAFFLGLGLMLGSVTSYGTVKLL